MVFFLHPSALWFLLGAGVLLAIHLFHFRRARRLPFSHFFLLTQATRQGRHRRKLRRWLILSLRTLFFSCLVMAFAMPYFPSGAVDAVRSHVLFFVDNTKSMSRRTPAGLTGLEEAVLRVRNILRNYSSDARYKLLTQETTSSWFANKEDLLSALAALNHSAGSGTWHEMGERLLFEAGTAAACDMYWLSDFSESMFGPSPGVLSDSLHAWNLLPASFSSHENVYVDTVYFSSPFLVEGHATKLCVFLSNVGDSDRRQLPVRLLSEGQQLGLRQVDVPARGRSEVYFELHPQRMVRQRMPLQIQIKGDAVLFDNDFYVYASSSEPLMLSLVSDSPYAMRVLNALYSDETLFSFRSFASHEVDYPYLARSELVILANVSHLSEALRRALRLHVQEGKTLVLWPSAEMDETTFQSVLGFSLLKVSDETLRPLKSVAYEHSFYSEVFARRQTRGVRLPKARRMYDISRGMPLLSFADGHAFLSLAHELRVYVFSCPLEPPFSTFLNHSLAVPTFYRMAFLSRDRGSPYVRLPDVRIRMPVPSDDAPYVLSLSTVSGNPRVHIPSQHKLSGSVWLFPSSEHLQEGFYDIRQGDKVGGHVAVNLSAQESRLRAVDAEKLSRLFSDVRHFSFLDIEPVAPTTEARWVVRRDLWPWCLALALFFACLEVLCLRWLRHSREEGSSLGR